MPAPPPFKNTYPCTILPPLFLIFQIPSLPPSLLKKGGSKLWLVAIKFYKYCFEFVVQLFLNFTLNIQKVLYTQVFVLGLKKPTVVNVLVFQVRVRGRMFSSGHFPGVEINDQYQLGTTSGPYYGEDVTVTWIQIGLSSPSFNIGQDLQDLLVVSHWISQLWLLCFLYPFVVSRGVNSPS